MFNYNQFIIDDFYRMSFQNVFHSKNMNISNLYGAWKNKILINNRKILMGLKS